MIPKFIVYTFFFLKQFYLQSSSFSSEEQQYQTPLSGDHTGIDAYGITRKREKRLPEIARGVRKHVTPILRILSFPRFLAAGSIRAHCASCTCKESNLYNPPSSPSTRHTEDLAGSDGNMRTVTDRASDRRNSTPTDHK
ncbi:PREDICTED: uncharacterized protein LOC108749273 [Trachymyrmex septentrionalis]|uniref:uncharacterized protein LOC108749273 n=1 Tax=Trachymyrmex septentrionalis TaxID=34720 RepID=UPI00084EF943|nr:PREDICTED: uncharacterized protein LOC108749273 [Trachymyrmex septentrionalis]